MNRLWENPTSSQRSQSGLRQALNSQIHSSNAENSPPDVNYSNIVIVCQLLARTAAYSLEHRETPTAFGITSERLRLPPSLIFEFPGSGIFAEPTSPGVSYRDLRYIHISGQ